MRHLIDTNDPPARNRLLHLLIGLCAGCCASAPTDRGADTDTIEAARGDAAAESDPQKPATAATMAGAASAPPSGFALDAELLLSEPERQGGAPTLRWVDDRWVAVWARAGRQRQRAAVHGAVRRRRLCRGRRAGAGK